MNLHRRNGFTLIEIIISLSILVVGLVALLALFISSFDVAMKAANLTEATIYAQQKMEEVKKAGYDLTLAGTTTGSFNPTYSWTLVVTNEAPTGYLRKASLTVSWTYRGKTFNENFIYYLAKFSP